MKIYSMAVLLLLGLVSITKAEEKEPQYRIQETHVMESPISNKEFENWETKLTSIFNKNNIVLVPEINGAKGAILNKAIVGHRDDWIVDVKLTVGNEEQTAKGGAGMAFYYMEEINQD